MRKFFLILVFCCLIGVGIFIVRDKLFFKTGVQPLSCASVFYWDGQDYKEEKKDISSLYWKFNKSLTFVRTPIQESRRESETVDFDGDGTEERIELTNGTVFIYQGEDVWWQSDPDWQVENILLADLNGDGKVELNMSLWKIGSYGDDLPFWVEENDTDLGSHFFIYGFKEGEIRPVWCSSTVDDPIKEMTASDINGDGKDELIVFEGTYDQPRDTLAKHVSIWSWNGWGFSNDFRSEEGGFFDLEIRRDLDDENCIVVKSKL